MLMLPSLALSETANYDISKRYKFLHNSSVFIFPISRNIAAYYNNKVLKKYPNFVPALTVKYSINMMNEKFSIALKVSDRLIELEPDNIDYKINRLIALMALEKWEEYDNELIALYSQYPDNFDLTYYYMIRLEEIGKVDEAKHLADKLLKMPTPEDDFLSEDHLEDAVRILGDSEGIYN